ncbi:baseplate J/gp47 family protein [Burkholderia vietnamiensis]|uniref:baseplate assembly protein n=1 Tax=Burkholderia vietnamiensis TaxID=60552 RepID=UPI00075C8F55|nr:baseplate J/gp47 family protein [Burkholderia vietnamiensis]KVF73370.1 baseplate J protein [Burkholderia vietnamiensis]KVF84824.1 baseplate J protein [Burkholderia vietnamiensis]KVF87661.1 baseplate J protein [Burkholderia vietnamiensis]KVF98793.1 baseplate J protein [Burkholderia vietnamiensis]
MTVIDLSALDPPDLVEMLDFEELYQRKLEHFKRIYPDWTAALESDPVVKLLELAAYEDVRFRARVNDAGRAVLLAYATGADLEHLAALWNLKKEVVDPGDPEAHPPIPVTYERDERLRLRTQMGIERASTAGPFGAYRSMAMDASADVADVRVDRPEGGVVRVVVKSYSNGGVASAALLDTVRRALSPEDRRPLNDTLLVVPARPVEYSIDADVYIGRGPDPGVVLAARRQDLDIAIAAGEALRVGMPRSAVTGALHPKASGVVRVDLKAPVADVVCAIDQFARCTSIVLNPKVNDDD